MQHLVLGIGLGLATIVPPGPIGLTLIGVATRQGTAPALHGAAGIAGGDLAGATVAFAVVAAGSSLPASVFGAAQVVAALILLGLGVVLLVAPGSGESAIDRIRHPGRTLFVLTGAAPHALASWVALYVAMPFARDVWALASFGLGVVVASMLWHPVLAVASSAAGASIGPRLQRPISLIGGLAMMAMGAVSLLVAAST